MISSLKPGDEAKILYQRNDAQMSVKVTLCPTPSWRMNFLWPLLLTFPVFEGNKDSDVNSTEFSLPAQFRLNGKSTQAAFGRQRTWL